MLKATPSAGGKASARKRRALLSQLLRELEEKGSYRRLVYNCADLLKNDVRVS